MERSVLGWGPLRSGVGQAALLGHRAMPPTSPTAHGTHTRRGTEAEAHSTGDSTPLEPPRPDQTRPAGKSRQTSTPTPVQT